MSPAAYADPTTALRFKGHVKNTKSSVELGGGLGEQQTELMVLSSDGQGSPEVLVYCIDLKTLINDRSDYNEVTWADSWLKDTAKVAKINWVLNNSYPKIKDLGALKKTAGVGKDLEADEAVAATQAAIWHFSNGANLNLKKNSNDSEVIDLYKYLTGPANVGAADEPGASLELSPSKISGQDGDTPGVGPVLVKTSASVPVDVKLNGAVPAGVKLVDKNGAPVSKAPNGTELFVDVPEGTKPGSTRIDAAGKAGVRVGRVFTAADHRKSQTLISAGSTEFGVTASARVEWKKKPVAVPSATYKEDCLQGGVSVVLTNSGDAPADFNVAGTKITVPGGESKVHFVKVDEDAEYSITVTGPGKFSETYTGKLDCVTPPVEPSEPPTTEPPVTETPTTEPPVTEPPSTEPPVTEPPSTEPPVTEPPTTEPPTTEPPTTEPPVTEPPTTEPPVTEPPTTEPPVTEPPTTEPPVTEPPSTEPPTTTQPSTTPSATTPQTTEPAASASPTKSAETPGKPIVEPGTPDEPVEVPWLPVSNDQDLAETGSDSSTPIMIGGAAAALLIAGGGAVYFNRRRGAHQA